MFKKNNLQIREATIGDLQNIIDLEKIAKSKLYSTGTEKADVINYIETENILLAYSENELSGKISYKEIDATIQISGLIILPKFRGRGWGKMLSKYIIGRFPKIRLFNLTVHPKNIFAKNIYIELGFIPVRTIDNFYGDGEPRLIMELRR